MLPFNQFVDFVNTVLWVPEFFFKLTYCWIEISNSKSKLNVSYLNQADLSNFERCDGELRQVRLERMVGSGKGMVEGSE